MKRLLLMIAALAATAGTAFAQVYSPSTLGTPANIAGQLYASTFAGWSIPQGNNGPLSWSYASACSSATAGGVTFNPLMVGMPIRIVDANPSASETVTVTTVQISGAGCTISVTPQHSHLDFYLTSATAGLQEALNYAGTQPYVVAVTPDFTREGGTTATITSAIGHTSVSIADLRNAVPQAYTWNGSSYVLSPIGSGGNPGGASYSVQYNGGASFSGAAINGLGLFSTSAAPRAATPPDISSVLQSATGCTTPGYTFSPQSGTCIPGSGTGATLPTNALVYGLGATTSRAVGQADVNPFFLSPGPIGSTAPNTVTSTYNVTGSLNVTGSNCSFLTGLPGNPCEWHNFSYLNSPTSPNLSQNNGVSTQFYYSGPGINVGNPGGMDCGTGYVNCGGWSQADVSETQGYFLTRGITSVHNSLNLFADKVGDTFYEYPYLHYATAVYAASDEATKLYGGQLLEETGIYTGNATAISITAAAAPAPSTQENVTLTMSNSSVAQGDLIDGAMLLDKTMGYIPCTLNGASPTAWNSTPIINQFTVTGCTPPQITAWGTITGKVGNVVTQNANITTSQTVTIATNFGTFGTPTPGGHAQSNFVCLVDGTNTEVARVTAFSGTSMTLNVGKYHIGPVYAFQGACAPQYGVSDDADAANSTQMSVYWTPGAFGQNLLIYKQIGEAIFPWAPRVGETPEKLTDAIHLIPMAEVVSHNGTNIYTSNTIQIADAGLGDTMTTADVLLEPHPTAVSTCAICVSDYNSQYRIQSFPTHSIYAENSGVGATQAWHPVEVQNGNPSGMYTFNGGWAATPNFAYGSTGNFSSGFFMDQSPVGNGTVNGVMDVAAFAPGQTSFTYLHAPTGNMVFDNSNVLIPRWDVSSGGEEGMVAAFFQFDKGRLHALGLDATNITQMALGTVVTSGTTPLPGYVTPAGTLHVGGLIDDALTPGTGVVCPNGTSGALVNTGCTAPASSIAGLITAGTNVTITGSGTSGSPYSIAATGAAGVSSLNSLTGALSIAAGTGVTVTPSGSTITISSTATSGVTSINSTSGAFTFTGAGVSCSTTTCTFSGTGGSLTGSGTTNYMPLWTGTSALGNSHIDDGATTAGIITASEPVAVTSATISAPGTVTPTGSTTGGTLAAATYFYVVTATNPQGETTVSPEASVTTTGTTSSVALTWTAVTGATGYKVYRGTATGAENTYYTTATASYADTGAAGTAGTPPTTNTTAKPSEIFFTGNPSPSSVPSTGAAIGIPTSVTTPYVVDLPAAPATGFPFWTNNSGTMATTILTSIPHANIAATAVTPGSYTSANITVAPDGSITAASNGTGGTSIANITLTLPTTVIAANTCTTAATATMTGLATTSAFLTAFATNPNSVTGWGATGGLVFTAWPTANTLNWSVCNETSASITPGAMSLNVGAR